MVVNLAKQEKKQSKEQTTQKEDKKIITEHEDKKRLEKWKIGKKNFS